MQSSRATTAPWEHWGLRAGDDAQISRRGRAEKRRGRGAMVAHQSCFRFLLTCLTYSYNVKAMMRHFESDFLRNFFQSGV